MKSEEQTFEDERSRIWGQFACISLGSLLLMLSAGIAVGFNPDDIATRSEAFLFWTQFIAGIVVVAAGLGRAKIAFEALERKVSTRDSLADPSVEI